MELPIFENARIKSIGVTLVDATNASKRANREASEILDEVLVRRMLSKVRPGVQMCGMEQDHRLGGMFMDAQRTDPTLKYTPFLDQIGDDIVLDDSDCDPRLGTKALVVRQNKIVLGSFVLYNVVVEKETAQKVTISAMAAPACRAASWHSVRATWSLLMRWMLNNDFVAEDGKAYNLVEWRFPSRPSHQWVLNDDEHERSEDDEFLAAGEQIVSDLSGDFDLTTVDGVPRKIRRREVKR